MNLTISRISICREHERTRRFGIKVGILRRPITTVAVVKNTVRASYKKIARLETAIEPPGLFERAKKKKKKKRKRRRRRRKKKNRHHQKAKTEESDGSSCESPRSRR